MEGKWKNQHKTLVVSSHGIGHRDRHLMKDLARLLPHAESAGKLSRSTQEASVKHLCQTFSCSSFLYLEARKRASYLWLGLYPDGPSIQLLLERVQTAGELKLAGNCVRHSRPLLSFDESFEASPFSQLFKQMFTQTFAVPAHHCVDLCDRVLSFALTSERVLFRHYQIKPDQTLAEIGPRFAATPVLLLDGVLCGPVLYTRS